MITKVGRDEKSIGWKGQTIHLHFEFSIHLRTEPALSLIIFHRQITDNAETEEEEEEEEKKHFRRRGTAGLGSEIERGESGAREMREGGLRGAKVSCF